MVQAWREITAEWQGESTFIGKNTNGGSVQMGKIGNKPGISPMELILAGLAGCTGVDIVSILSKQRQNFTDMKVQVRAKRADDFPKVYTEFEVTYLIWSEDIDPQAVERAIRLSEDKYCSVGLMLSKAAPIHSTYRILKPGQEA